MRVMRSFPFYCSQMFTFQANSEKCIEFNWGKYAHKKPFSVLFHLYHCWLLTTVTIMCILSFFRWKYGFRISAPSIKRSWSMAADQRENISTALAPSPPARPGCHSFGRSPWRTKEPKCTQTITWTVLVTGIQTTTLIRTRCPGLRWCEWIVFGVVRASCSGLYEGHFGLHWTCSQKASSQNWFVFKCVFNGTFMYFVCVFNSIFDAKKKIDPASNIFFRFVRILVHGLNWNVDFVCAVLTRDSWIKAFLKNMLCAWVYFLGVSAA